MLINTSPQHHIHIPTRDAHPIGVHFNINTREPTSLVLLTQICQGSGGTVDETKVVGWSSPKIGASAWGSSSWRPIRAVLSPARWRSGC
jgi:hypothetical protein